MKKVFVPLVVLFSVFFAQNVFSQTTHRSGTKLACHPMQVGSIFVNMGVGVGADYKAESYGTAFGFKVAAEYGLWEAGPGVITSWTRNWRIFFIQCQQRLFFQIKHFCNRRQSSLALWLGSARTGYLRRLFCRPWVSSLYL